MRDFQPTQHLLRSSESEALRRALRGKGEVLEPHEAEEPILAAPVRSAVFGWLAELNARAELKAVGIKPRSSALLSGPPGCGKTTLAHHLAARLGVPMVNVGSEHLISSGFGDSEKNVATLFDAIKAIDKPCLVFLDEIDSIGGKRLDTSGDRGGAVSARNSTLNVLLRKVEDFNGLLVAATNRADTLDPALWRRFGMQIEVALPDTEARWAILKRYGEPFQFGDDLLDKLTEMTEGAAPSLLRQLMEGVKRLIILGARTRQPVSTMAAAFGIVAAQTRPHPDYDPPLLWSHTDKALTVLREVSGTMPWPPERAKPPGTGDKEAAR
jgi:energy-coupling factor transporter ATP-binding protein EcfA2